MSLLAAAAVALRLMNPNDVSVEATLRCGGESRAVVLDAREVRDVEGCQSATSPVLPLLVLETSVEDGVESQTALDPDAGCAVPRVYVPLFACRNGTATASTDPTEGARYEWTAEGATILGDANASRITLQIVDATVKLACRVVTADCPAGTTAQAAVAVREPIVVQELKVPATAVANEPVTITWSYQPGREPQSQALTGNLFPQPVVLSASQRSYTFTPQTGGSRTIELRASYAKVVPLAPPAKKRRRSVSGGVAASECPSALATAKLDVTGCVQAEPILDAPLDVAAGAEFTVKVDLEDGQRAEWSVENGALKSVSPFFDYATFVAGATGQAKVTARVQRKPGCFVSASANVAILQPANQCAVPPVANVVFSSQDCNAAVMHATFTGTGPFAGEWSDGTEFRTASNNAAHAFTTPGTYTIRNFRDSACFGNVSGEKTVTTLRPTAVLEAKQSCGVAHLTATLSGVPPFNVTWSDGTKVTTNDTVVTHDIEGGTDRYWLKAASVSVTDAVCSISASSRTIQVQPQIILRYGGYPYCQSTPGRGVWLQGYFENAPIGPYRLEWTDGATAISPFGGYAERLVYTEGASATYPLAKAFAGECELDVQGKVATVYNRPVAVIQKPSSTNGCTTEPLTATLSVVPQPEATITWMTTNNARILTGQGTPTVTFTADSPIKFDLTVRTTFADGHCNLTSDKVAYTFVQRQTVRNIRVEPSTIPPGGRAVVTWEPVDGTPASVTTTAARTGDLHKDTKCCTATFLDTAGVAASVPIYVSWYDPCAGSQTHTLTLTIAP